MSLTFLDTSYFIALLRKRDQHNAAANVARRLYTGPFLTTEFVVLELLDAMSSPSLRQAALATVARIRASSNTEVVPATSAWLEAGIAYYRTRLDKDWGLTDCIWFAVMQQRGITDALTADRHFEQAGFRALLRSTLQ